MYSIKCKNAFCNWKLGVDFPNFLWAAFTHTDPKSVKKTDNLTVLIAALGSALIKAARRKLIKLSPALKEMFGSKTSRYDLCNSPTSHHSFRLFCSAKHIYLCIPCVSGKCICRFGFKLRLFHLMNKPPQKILLIYKWSKMTLKNHYATQFQSKLQLCWAFKYTE